MFEEAGYDASLTMMNTKIIELQKNKNACFILDLEKIYKSILFFQKVAQMMIKKQASFIMQAARWNQA